MTIFRSILSQKNLVVRRTTRPQFLVVLTFFLVAEDVRTLEFCYPVNHPTRLRLAIFLFKCCLGLPVVRERSGVVTMKSIDMYILHDSSLVVSFSNILRILGFDYAGVLA